MTAVTLITMRDTIAAVFSHGEHIAMWHAGSLEHSEYSIFVTVAPGPVVAALEASRRTGLKYYVHKQDISTTCPKGYSVPPELLELLELFSN